MQRFKRRRHGEVLLPFEIFFVGLAALAALWPVVHNQFVNWDDPDVLINNPHLAGAGSVAWAFTTTHMGHYQPIAWLVWSSVRWRYGLTPAAFHAVSLAGHVLNSMLVYAVVLRLTEAARLPLAERRIAATATALVFSLHPAQVETVAWASALPYVLSLTFLLLAFLVYLNGRRVASLACYGVSLLARANGVAFPVVLLIVDVHPLDRLRQASLRSLTLEKIPFIVLACASTIAESHARDIATLQEVGAGARLTLAVTAPFVYLRRTLLPVHLSPLDPLPIAPAIELMPLLLGTTGLVAVTAAAWMLRRRWPAFIGTWIAYLALLAPAAGLTPSGLQSTADRYLYLPGIAVAVAAGLLLAALSTTSRRGAVAVAVATVALAASGVQAWRQTHYWRHSVALWTHAADIDPRNDVATYNLAIALAEAGREDEAIARYEQTLALVPDHELARRNLALIRAARAEREGDRLVAAGRRDEAAASYTEALALDGKRLHARAARGLLAMQRGRFDSAADDLQIAFAGGVRDPAIPNGLAFSLTQTGRSGDAAAVLERAVTEHPDDINLLHNLARLLATADDPRLRDGELALRLAIEVRDRTGGRDPRALDTLAAAYFASGRPDKARETANEAEALARTMGDRDMAQRIAARARRYHQDR